MTGHADNTAFFDFGQPIQVTTVAGLRATSVQPCTASWDEVFGTVHPAASKDTAPAIIPATFDADTLLWTKAGRPNKSGATGCTAVLVDFDGCPDGTYTIESGDLEEALNRLGLAGTYWSTWSATEVRPRWRVALPLVAPVKPSAQERVWTAVARALVGQLRAVVKGGEKLDADWAARHATQLAILPCAPTAACKATPHKTYPWGGLVPHPVHVDGKPVSLEEVDRAKNADHYGRRLAFVARARAREGSTTGCNKPPVPYKGSAEAPEAPVGLAAWRADRTATLTLTAGLDAVEHARRHGLGARPGGRGSALAAGCFHLYRCGAPVPAIRAWAEAALTATGGRAVGDTLLKDLAGQVRDFAGRAEAPHVKAWCAMARAALDAADPKFAPRPHQVEAAATFLNLLARAEHLRRDGGGQVSFSEVALVVGMPTAAVVCWRRTLQDANLLDQFGSGRTTHYRLLVGVTNHAA